MGVRVAVVGATGAVGREMIEILEERRFPVEELIPLASERSAGASIPFGGTRHAVRELTHEELAGVDLALVSAGASVSRAHLPRAADAGVACVDNSSAFRMEPDVPLVIPEVNPEALDGSPRIVAVPNCTTITAMLPIAPLHRVASMRSLVLSSYQSVSGAGTRGMRELAEQVEKLHAHVDDLGDPNGEAMPVGEVFGKTIAFNVLARIGEFESGGFTGEESKMMAEPRKILGLPDLEIAATSVRVPVVVGHAVSIMATFARPLDPDEAREVLRESPGIQVRDDPANGIYPSPLEAAGIDDALVGRIRAVPGRDDALLLFSCADNLRKGAALNAVQIAERLLPA
jgi:aspartate-semialdehyde dehydrogenase